MQRQRSDALSPTSRMLMDRLRNVGRVNMSRLMAFISMPATHITSMTHVKRSERLEKKSIKEDVCTMTDGISHKWTP